MLLQNGLLTQLCSIANFCNYTATEGFLYNDFTICIMNIWVFLDIMNMLYV